ncbi:MAG: NrfD/PsrC family molybdoenzyme membrane anchor subunit [Pseudomonadota bacterium]
MPTKPYEWMVEYTPQKEWIDRRGLLVWLAEVASGLGGGLYLVSSYFDSLIGMFISWIVIIVLKGGFHFAYLGHPLRFWRMGLKPSTSWLARGFIFMTLFIIFGALQLTFSHLLPGTAWEILFKVLAGMMAFLLTINTGFVLSSVHAVPLWNSAILPILFLLCGILDGLAVVILIGLFSGNVHIQTAEVGIRLFIIMNALLITLYLWSAVHAGQTGKRSVFVLIKGQLAPVLWIGVVSCGIVIPLIISISSFYIGKTSAIFLVMAVVCEMIGVLSLKYSLLKGGIYHPLI